MAKRKLNEGNWVEVKRKYCFREPHIAAMRRGDPLICVDKGDIGRISRVHPPYQGDIGYDINFTRKDGKSFSDSTSDIYLVGILRKMDKRKRKDRIKINRVYYQEEDD